MVIWNELEKKFIRKKSKLLFTSLCAGNVEEVKRLIDRGAKVDAKDDVGGTALHRAAENGNFKSIASEIHQLVANFMLFDWRKHL